MIHEHVSCELILTGRCNMRCDYCIAKDLPHRTMTEEVARKAVDLFVYLASGAKDIEFTFTGGEPLLAFSVMKSVTAHALQRTSAACMEAHFIIKTNGTRLDDEIIGFLQSYRVKVVVSVDGLEPVHNAHRCHQDGTKTHNTVCQNISTLLHNGISCVASMTVHPDSLSMVADGIQFLHRLGVEQVDVGPVYDTTEWTTGTCGAWVQALMESADYVRQVHTSGGHLDIGPFYRESEHRNGILTDHWGCHAASSNLAFLPTGEITGCSALGMMINRFPSLILGNVTDGISQKSVDLIVNNAKAGRDVRTSCCTCPTAPNCTGGCLAINLATTGAPFVPPKFYCDTISAIPTVWERAWRL